MTATDTRTGQSLYATQRRAADPDQDTELTIALPESTATASARQTTQPAILESAATVAALAGPDHPADHSQDDYQREFVGGDQLPPQARPRAPITVPSPAVDQDTSAAIVGPRTKPVTPLTDEQGQPATVEFTSRRAALADPLLALAADVVDDLEKVRIANENRLRQLTRTEVDSDGEVRGFGLDETHPDVARLAALVAMLADAEHQAILQLQRTVRRHPLNEWRQSAAGVGEKQLARLLATIGDPYWNTLHNRPRTVSELWAYSGLHTVSVNGQTPPNIHLGRAVDGSSNPASQQSTNDQRPHPGGDQPGDTDHDHADSQILCVGVAAKRRRGERANWSTTAKMRAYLIAESVIKQVGNGDATRTAESEGPPRRRSPYRDVYDQRRTVTAERIHAVECVRCGPSGKPAQPGSPWSAGHQHADALRIVAKRILRDLWRAARDIHLGHRRPETQSSGAEVEQSTTHP